jgi:uncharacterized membrane protein
VTAPVEGVPDQSRSKGRLVMVALALSVALNVFFVGGLVYGKFMRPGPGAPLVALGRELDLTPVQRGAFRDFIQVARSKGEALRETNRKLGEQVWDEISKPEPDKQKLATLIGQVADNRREYQAAVTGALIPFLANLDQERRRHFVEIARRRQDAVANRMRQLLGP